mmetsp:Transcript_6757/g.20034  ORF Transcript_6757/g.20034 Transcript_6757/m.20034 type:complete len:224 (-) Transcript_6757:1642-2313(-)
MMSCERLCACVRLGAVTSWGDRRARSMISFDAIRPSGPSPLVGETRRMGLRHRFFPKLAPSATSHCPPRRVLVILIPVVRILHPEPLADGRHEPLVPFLVSLLVAVEQPVLLCSPLLLILPRSEVPLHELPEEARLLLVVVVVLLAGGGGGGGVREEELGGRTGRRELVPQGVGVHTNVGRGRRRRRGRSGDALRPVRGGPPFPSPIRSGLATGRRDPPSASA